jgi:hypothetical protein
MHGRIQIFSIRGGNLKRPARPRKVPDFQAPALCCKAFAKIAVKSLMQGYRRHGAGNLLFAPGLDLAWRIEGRGDVGALACAGESRVASLIGYGDFAFEHEHPIFVERSAPELRTAHADIGDRRRDRDVVLLQPFDAARGEEKGAFGRLNQGLADILVRVIDIAM